MNAEDRPTLSADGIVLVLTCTSCYQPDLSAFPSGNTGCPRCGGWTWIAQLATTETTGSQPW
jgi:hypothetical protein